MSTFEIRHGDAMARLAEMPNDSIHCCVTSPPYFGLRDYGTGTWEGGDVDCKHKHGGQVPQSKNLPAAESVSTGLRPGTDNSICRACGAARVDRQIGLEKTPDEFVSKLVGVFREVRRVLRQDGTCWINIGDSYAGSWGNQGRKETRGTQREINAPMMQPVHDGRYASKQSNTGKIPEGSGLKPKDLIGVPWMLAFALRADGWWLRQDIIWSKPNTMPESVRDRCTKAHEYVFLLTKAARYSMDMDAVKEPATDTGRINGRDGRDEDPAARPPGSNPRTLARIDYSNLGRNKRSVWSLSTLPTPDAHFATFPIELPETCILAGCPVDGVVLDPFAGAGTTGLAALKNGRRFIGIELNAEYIEIANRRVHRHYPLLAVPA